MGKNLGQKYIVVCYFKRGGVFHSSRKKKAFVRSPVEVVTPPISAL